MWHVLILAVSSCAPLLFTLCLLANLSSEIASKWPVLFLAFQNLTYMLFHLSGWKPGYLQLFFVQNLSSWLYLATYNSFLFRTQLKYQFTHSFIHSFKQQVFIEHMLSLGSVSSLEYVNKRDEALIFMELRVQ